MAKIKKKLRLTRRLFRRAAPMEGAQGKLSWLCHRDAPISFLECPDCRSVLGRINDRGFANTPSEENNARRKDIKNVAYLVVFGTSALLTIGVAIESFSGRKSFESNRLETIQVRALYSAFVEDQGLPEEQLVELQQLRRFRGSVIEISTLKDGEHRMLVRLHTGSEAQHLPAEAYFSLDQEPEIQALLIGQIITFEGKFQELVNDGRLKFRDCTLLRRSVQMDEELINPK